MSCKDCFHRDACLAILKSAFPTLKEDEIERVSERDNGCKRFISAADVVEVRHGEWELDYVYANDYSNDNTRKVFRCSLCGRIAKQKEPYCNCGAKMNGEENKQ